MIRIMIVDDHSLVVAGLSEIILNTKGMEVVAQAHCGMDAVNLARTNRIDVVILDIQLPDLSGLHVTKKLLKIQPHLKILVLTGIMHDIFPVRLLAAGARAYLNKSTDHNTLLRTIRAIHRGEQIIAPEIATRLAFAKVEKKALSPFDKLSNQELEIVMMTVRGMKPNAIAEHLHLSIATVHSYRNAIFKKARVEHDVALTFLAIKEGILDAEKS